MRWNLKRDAWIGSGRSLYRHILRNPLQVPIHPRVFIAIFVATATFFTIATGFVQVNSRSGTILLLQRALSLQAVHSTAIFKSGIRRGDRANEYSCLPCFAEANFA
jgi:hypothetical protein